MKESTNAYQEHANRCRELAEQKTSREERDILLKIAETWDWISRDFEPLDIGDSKSEAILKAAK